jgi:hypothetical protein
MIHMTMDWRYFYQVNNIGFASCGLAQRNLAGLEVRRDYMARYEFRKRLAVGWRYMTGGSLFPTVRLLPSHLFFSF